MFGTTKLHYPSYYPHVADEYNAHALYTLSESEMNQYLDYVETYVASGRKFTWMDVKDFRFGRFNIHLQSEDKISCTKIPSKTLYTNKGLYLGRDIQPSLKKQIEGRIGLRVLDFNDIPGSKPPYINRDILRALTKRGVNTAWDHIFCPNQPIIAISLAIKLAGYYQDDMPNEAFAKKIADEFMQRFDADFIRQRLLDSNNPSRHLTSMSVINMVDRNLRFSLMRFDAAKEAVRNWKPPKI